MIPPRPRKRRGPSPTHPFDKVHGTETGSLIPGDDLSTGHRHDRHITAYHGTSPSLFSKLLARWQTFAQHPIEQTAFIDIGAGKGRAMLLATQHPFRRIIGVELHPALAAAARTNIERYQSTNATPPIRLVEDDVLRLPIPAGPCLFWVFNPFGAVLMDRFLMRLAAQFKGRPGQCDILYINDEMRRLFTETHPNFKPLWQGRVHLSREDRAADKATIAHDANGLYVTTGYEDCSSWRLST